MPSGSHQGVRAVRRLTAPLTDDLPPAALRSGLSDHGFDHSGCLLLAWREADPGVFEGALVDASDGPFECRFHGGADAELGLVEELSRVPIGAIGTRFDWTQTVKSAKAVRRLDAESPAQRERRLAAFEERHGVRLPDDFRGFMVDHEGWLGWTGSGDWLEIVSIDELDEWNLVPQTETHPGLVLIGSDGRRELVGFDNRQQPAPPPLVGLLSQVFTKFDEFVEELGLEKIKTVGDEDMVAAGVHVPRDDHSEAIAELALRIRDYMATHEFDGKRLELRIGIHSGPVVAGIIGTHKFAYDLWGDTVNTASRMESGGVPGQIQVTPTIYELLANNGYAFEARGTIDVKGKGPMDTWLLTGRS